MFQRKHCMSTEQVWFPYESIQPGTPVDIRWGIRWAHIYMNGEKLGKILRSAAKQKFIELK